jgi:cellobiose phosphorylase
MKPREFVGLCWMKNDKETRAPNIIKMVRWSNHVVQWLSTEIVSVKDSLKQRAVVMEKVVSIAKVLFILTEHLDNMNNLNGVKEVLAALQSSSVYRLRKTKEVSFN